jgi:D-alanyl-lipoteichoic acid acyltransferase DltB (MBOAT superfamily)
MSVLKICFLAVLAVIAGLLRKGRGLVLLAFSTFLVFWLQPRFGNPSFTFFVPLATLFLAILSWGITSTKNSRSWKKNYPALCVILGVTVLFWLNRYFHLDLFFEASTPRLILLISAWVFLLVGLLIILRVLRWQRGLLVLSAIVVISLLILVKSDVIAGYVRLLINKLIGKYSTLILFQFQWLGFSYIAFRLLHTFFEKRAGRMPEVSLEEYINYAIFFPALSAGPIDRIERFISDLREPKRLDNEGWLYSGKRLAVGLFKKFVIADSLALLSLDKLDTFVKSPLWLWILVYIYAFRIYFDFSGYTDIAIGLGRLAGVQLPENFLSPYTKPNLTLFWNSWHITLTQWFRSYYFNPLVRKIRQLKIKIPDFLVIFFAQITTMLLIGLWHGFSWNFIIWGAWHGIGLFFHNRWSVWIKPRMDSWASTPIRRNTIKVFGIIITFNYVALGWVFFLIPIPAEAKFVLLKMFGIS